MSKIKSKKMIVIYLIISTIFITLLHLGVAYFICDFFNISKLYTKVLISTSVVLPILYVASNFFINFYQNTIIDLLYKYLSIWMAIFLYLLMASILLIAYKFLEGRIASVFDLHITRESGKIVAYLIYAGAVLLNVYGLINAKNINIVERDIYIKNLPTSWQNKSAVFIADTHYGRIYKEKAAIETVSLINNIKPDYVFFSGDFYDGPSMDYASVSDPYKDIKVKKFFVSGNHEYYAESRSQDDNILSHISDAGFIILNSSSTVLNGVRLIGVDYDRDKNQTKDMIDVAYNSFVRDELPSIVLKHIPNNIDKLEKEGADLVLAGHTHNGQVFPFNIISKIVYKGLNYGLKNVEETQVLITSGVGSWGPIQRIGSSREIVHISFMREK
jgi:uncharacterized protein